MTDLGALINVRSTNHSHFKSILIEGLWGFPLDKKGINKVRWSHLVKDTPIFLYCEHNGIRGIWALCKVINRKFSRKPVNYWVKNPVGFPLHIKFEFILPVAHKPSPDNPFILELFDQVKPIKREELASKFRIRAFKALTDRWSLYIFGDKNLDGITYSYNLFEEILNEFKAKNELKKAPKRLRHEEVKELIYNIGIIQGKNPAKEYPLEDKRLDVVWRKTSKSVPYIAFEIHDKGDLYADLVKLKHAWDLWNAIPVLITTESKVEEAWKWIKGTFHEVKDVFRVITFNKLKDFYEAKRKVKELETELGLI